MPVREAAVARARGLSAVPYLTIPDGDTCASLRIRSMDIVNERIEQYLRELQARHDEPGLLEMEQEAREHA